MHQSHRDKSHHFPKNKQKWRLCTNWASSIHDVWLEIWRPGSCKEGCEGGIRGFKEGYIGPKESLWPSFAKCSTLLPNPTRVTRVTSKPCGNRNIHVLCKVGLCAFTDGDELRAKQVICMLASHLYPNLHFSSLGPSFRSTCKIE